MAAGPHPRRELTPMLPLGLANASGAHGRRHLSTGGAAPPPPRTDADAPLGLVNASGSHGRRRQPSLLAGGPHPRRELTPMLPSDLLTPRGRLAAGAHLPYWRRGPTPAAN